MFNISVSKGPTKKIKKKKRICIEYKKLAVFSGPLTSYLN